MFNWFVSRYMKAFVPFILLDIIVCAVLYVQNRIAVSWLLFSIARSLLLVLGCYFKVDVIARFHLPLWVMLVRTRLLYPNVVFLGLSHLFTSALYRRSVDFTSPPHHFYIVNPRRNTIVRNTPLPNRGHQLLEKKDVAIRCAD